MSNQELTTKLLFPKAGDKAANIPSDSVKCVVELHIAVTPEKLASLTKDGKYDSAYLAVLIGQVLLKSNNNSLMTWIERGIIPFTRIGLAVHNDCVRDAKRYGEFLLEARTPKEKPSKTTSDISSTGDLPSASTAPAASESVLPLSGECSLKDDPRFQVVSGYHKPDNRAKRRQDWYSWLSANWQAEAASQQVQTALVKRIQDTNDGQDEVNRWITTATGCKPMTENEWKGALLHILDS